MKSCYILLLALVSQNLVHAKIDSDNARSKNSDVFVSTTFKDITETLKSSEIETASLYDHSNDLDFIHGSDVSMDVLPLEMQGGGLSEYQGYDMAPTGSPLDTASQAIQIGRDLVALGSETYELVSKGTPITKTNAQPVSVLPKNLKTGKPIDPMQMEYFSAPVVKEFITKVTNGLGIEVIRFKYRVVFQYGGKFKGKGNYLTGVSIFPVDTWALWGWSFSASMKRVGISNRGSVENPIAGLTLNINYKFHSTFSIQDKTDTIFINGNGEFRKY